MSLSLAAIRKHRTLSVVAVLLVIGSIAATLMLFRERWFTYLTGNLSTQAYNELAKREHWTTRSFEVADGQSLRTLVREKTGRNRPVVIFFPGNAAEPLEVGQTFLDRVIQDEDWGGVACSYRGFAGNPGSPTPAQLAEDGWRIYEEIARSEPERAIHLVGHSLGASVLGGVLSRHLSRPPASVILLSSGPGVVMRANRFAWEHRYDALEGLGPRPYATLVIHGESDTTLPLEGGRAVSNRLRARFLALRTGHNELLEAPDAISAIRSFIASGAK